MWSPFCADLEDREESREDLLELLELLEERKDLFKGMLGSGGMLAPLKEVHSKRSGKTKTGVQAVGSLDE